MSGRLVLTAQLFPRPAQSPLGPSRPAWPRPARPGTPVSLAHAASPVKREERHENGYDDPADVTSQYAAWPATRRAAARRRGPAPGGEPGGMADSGQAEPGGPLVRTDPPRRQPRGLGDQLAAGPGDRIS